MEVMIALLISSLTIATSMTMLNAALARMDSASNKMEAMHMAREELEILRIMPFTNNALSVGVHQYTNNAVNMQYQVVPNTNSPSVKNIRMRVDWLERVSGATRQVEIWTSISKSLHQ